MIVRCLTSQCSGMIVVNLKLVTVNCGFRGKVETLSPTTRADASSTHFVPPRMNLHPHASLCIGL